MINKGQLLNNINLNAAYLSKIDTNAQTFLSPLTTTQAITGGSVVSTGTLSVTGSSTLTGNVNIIGTLTTGSAVTLNAQDGTNEGGELKFKGAGAYTIEFVNDRFQDRLRWHYNSNELLSLLSTGNFGVNTTNPGEKLEVTGNIKASGTVSAASYKTTTGSRTSIYGGDGSTANVQNYVSANPYSSTYGLVIYEDAAIAKWSNLQTDSVARPDKLFIGYMNDGTATGKLGIDINATGDLGVSGDIVVTGNRITFGNGSYLSNESDANLSIYGDGTVTIYGVTSPNGTVSVTTDNLFINKTGDAHARALIQLADGKMGWGPGSATRDTWLYRNGINLLKTDGAMIINGDLTIGTGTNSEYHKLVIKGPNQPTSSAGYQDISYEFNSAGSAKIRAYRGGGWGTSMQFLVNLNTAVGDVPDVVMHLGENGNVGIGNTNTGAYKLNVTGDTNVTGALNVTSTVAAAGYTGIRTQDLPFKRYRKTKILSALVAQGVSTSMSTLDATWTDIQWDANSHVLVHLDGDVLAPTIDYTLGATNTITFLFDVVSGSTFDIIVF